MRFFVPTRLVYKVYERTGFYPFDLLAQTPLLFAAFMTDDTLP